ncbi:hypothetical protein PF010_g9259 [Phytophthora fragariae]|uniref:Uncharacterized protein n=1 Tax=Phytophthora fragariae TaxID=53985 RepID=A0A6G0LCN6_9STRA|nr:hypothetical protein PF010_g9259 [Phytophthora fragariae]
MTTSPFAPARTAGPQNSVSSHAGCITSRRDLGGIGSGAECSIGGVGASKRDLRDIGCGAPECSIGGVGASKRSVVGLGSSYAGCSTSRRGIGDIGSGAECSIGGIGSVAKCNLGGIDRGAYRRAIGGIGVLVYPIGGASEHSIGGISSSDFSTSGIGSSYAGCGTFRHGCDNFSSWSSAGNAPRRDLSTIAGLSGVGGPSRNGSAASTGRLATTSPGTGWAAPMCAEAPRAETSATPPQQTASPGTISDVAASPGTISDVAASPPGAISATSATSAASIAGSASDISCPGSFTAPASDMTPVVDTPAAIAPPFDGLGLNFCPARLNLHATPYDTPMSQALKMFRGYR